MKNGAAAGAARVLARGKGDHQRLAVADNDITDHHFAGIGQVQIPAGMHRVADRRRTRIGLGVGLVRIDIVDGAPDRRIRGNHPQCRIYKDSLEE